ncbi:DNA polymerase I [Candidatus Fermentibacterales bacterium]|nr:DNA polymerase I [Candidatus Fermentibacterales bacterium]
MKLLLVDAPGLLYRGHFALARDPLTAPDGTVTSGVHHLFDETCSLLEQHSPDRFALVFDYPAPSFRSRIYPEYKANRPPAPPEIVSQGQIARRLCRALGFPCIEREGFEADDLIASLASQALGLGDGSSVLIVSSDKDLLQLLDERGSVVVLQPGRPGRPVREVRSVDVPDLMGVRADQIVDFLSLTGDSSDNVPGARGIGPGTASALLAEHDTLDNLMRSLASVSKKGTREKLERSAEQVEMSRKLILLRTEGIPDLDLDSASPSDPELPEAVEMLRELGFRKIAERLGLDLSEDLDSPSHGDTRVLLEPGDLDLLLRELLASGAAAIALDTETDSQDPIEANPIGLSLTLDGERAWYLPLAHSEGSLDIAKAVEFLSALEGRFGLVAQNVKYDLHVLRRMGVVWHRIAGDPFLAHYLLNPDSGGHGLSAMAASMMGVSVMSFGDLAGDSGSLADVPLRDVAEYCCTDSITAWKLERMLRLELSEDGDLLRIYEEVELPVAGILTGMEARGVGLDREALSDLEKAFSHRLADIELRARNMVGFSINLNSPSQVSHVLFEVLDLPVIRKTDKGARSSSMEVLAALSGRDPFVDLVIEYRELAKLLSTYVQKLPGFVSPTTGLIHTSFNQGVASTGRLSSSNPNLQNIPIRTERGRMVRRCFRAGGADEVLISCDYSQIELRVLAHLSGDENLIRAYEEGRDIHSSTAVAVFGSSDPDHRRKAKEINFSIVYGISPHGLSLRLGTTREEAAGIIDRYFESYPGVRSFFDECVEKTAEKGETRTILGRRRCFPEFAGSSGNRRKSLERVAVNTTVQGSAADIVKLAMIRASARLSREMPECGLVLQVHDELVTAAPSGSAESAASILREEMEHAFELRVPLTVETGIGSNWLEAEH